MKRRVSLGRNQSELVIVKDQQGAYTEERL